MKFSQERDFTAYTIRAYRPGAINITLPAILEADKPQPVEVKTLSRSCIISPKQLIEDWAPNRLDELLAEHLQAIVALAPEVVLLGTGETLNFPAQEILAELTAQQIGVEVMDTAAACRTYNILMNEGRRVVAGLINPPHTNG